MADDTILLAELMTDAAQAVDTVLDAGTREEPNAAELLRAINRTGGAICDGVMKACDRDLIELLLQGWSATTELRDYGDITRHPPPMSASIFIGKHPMHITIDPKLRLAIAPMVKFDLKFVVEFQATINGVRLNVIDNAIRSLEIGTISLAAKLKWGKADIPWNPLTKDVPMPGKIELSRPWSLSHQQ